MDTSDIISSILAGLTLFGILIALYLGLRAIRENRDLQKVKYREELLNDILNWLSDILECGRRYNKAALSQVRDENMDAKSLKISQSIITGNIGNDWISLHNRGQILRMSFPDKQNPIPKSMTILLKGMRELSDLNVKYRSAFLDLPEDIAKIVDLMEKLDEEEEEITEIHARSA